MNIAEIYWLGVATSMIYTMFKTWYAIKLIKASPGTVDDTDKRTRTLRRLFKEYGHGLLSAFIITTAACVFSVMWVYFVPRTAYLAFKKKT